MKLHPYMSRVKPFVLKKPYANDSQANRVYRMERSLVGMALYTHTDPEHLEAVLAHACRKRKRKVPELAIVDDKPEWYGMAYPNKIELNASYHGDNLFTLLHELAHYITWDEDEEDHGAGWVWEYLTLLSQYKILPLEHGLELCDDHGVSYG